MSRVVAIMVDGVVSAHASGVGAPGGYATLCGLDGNDPSARQEAVPLMPGALIDCETCDALWNAWKRYSARDFKNPRASLPANTRRSGVARGKSNGRRR